MLKQQLRVEKEQGVDVTTVTESCGPMVRLGVICTAEPSRPHPNTERMKGGPESVAS